MTDEHALQRRLDGPLLVFALATVPVIAIEQSSLGQPWDALAATLNWTIWIAFVLAAVAMLAASSNRWQWVRENPLDVAIVLLTSPWLPASLQAARAFRLLRLLRLVRAGQLARRLLTTEGVKDAALLAALTVLGGGAAFSTLEKSQDLSAWDGVWWAVTTVTTVGYGDIGPQTTGGRIVAMVVMFVGIGFVAILTAAAAERFMRSRSREDARTRAQLEEINARLDRIEAGVAKRS